MEIRIEPHTLIRANERGASEDEIKQVLNVGLKIPVSKNRFAKSIVFNFNSIWNNKFDEQKKIDVIYTIDNNLIVTVTVYVFYGKWE